MLIAEKRVGSPAITNTYDHTSSVGEAVDGLQLKGCQAKLAGLRRYFMDPFYMLCSDVLGATFQVRFGNITIHSLHK